VAVFAATPPLECLRLVCSLVMSGDPPSVIDSWISSGLTHTARVIEMFIYGYHKRTLAAATPTRAESYAWPSYGTRDAGQNLELRFMRW